LKERLNGLYSILYVDLSSPEAQKYFTSTSFSFQFSSLIFCINLSPSQVTQSIGKDRLLVHSLLLRLSLKELKSDFLGSGCNQILLESLEIFSKSQKKFSFILN
jgi:hypothetical protein